jgi:hypothetical protein
MDQIVNDHFGFGATDDVEGVMGSLIEDAKHEVIPRRSRTAGYWSGVRSGRRRQRRSECRR